MTDCSCARCETRRTGAAPWRGKYSRTALASLCERLGVKNNVVIKRGKCLGLDKELLDEGWVMPEHAAPPEGKVRFVNGCHATKRDGTHVIEINEALGAPQANRCLIHELTHAAQHERVGDPHRFQRMYSLGEQIFGYEENPYEVEAEHNALGLRDDFKVVVA